MQVRLAVLQEDCTIEVICGNNPSRPRRQTCGTLYAVISKFLRERDLTLTREVLHSINYP